MPEDSGQEKTEEATPRRRKQARERGTVARSVDLTGSVVLIGVLIMIPTAVTQLSQGLIMALHAGWGSISSDPSPGQLAMAAVATFKPILPGLAMLVGTIMFTGLAMNFGQVGFVLSGEALNPRLDRLNPAAGIKRLFSMTATFEGAKALGKAALFGFLAYSAISANWSRIMGLAWLSPIVGLSVIATIMKTMAIRIVMGWLALAALDYFFQRKRVDKELKMTKQEVKQEMKEMEQAPEVKMAIAQRRRRMSRRMMEAVKSADVVITNPTHYAVAIKYEAGKVHAPQVVAKGMDHLAFKIREVASEHKVPIVPNPPLARALYKHCDLGDHVPREYFQPVAEVLAYVYRTVKRVRKAR